MPRHPLLACCLPLIVAACAATPVQPIQTVAAPAASSEAHALAQAACAGCHSVKPYGLSPNPDAPEFYVIANTPGLTRETLRAWLIEAHNYPEQMDFYLEEDEAETLTDYMLTLRRADYQPPR
ncbi:hypothetical protein [Aurantiacibacter gangjinensis]|uniref:hypothetical protein n=1 Tax=Aurantiacibacter gangjinensis TaxID=502682 RepID=UPI00069ABF7A|nr:hypothetical protein [Aurantiacibacter gangjinensis]APE27028.1 hypothetical protein BMF35_a0199 [Aurantiacibacter gangjinensis]